MTLGPSKLVGLHVTYLATWTSVVLSRDLINDLITEEASLSDDLSARLSRMLLIATGVAV